MDKRKFLLSFSLHLFVLGAYLWLNARVSWLEIDGLGVIALTAFSIGYYILLWLDLYSQPYHHYLINAFKVVVRDMALAFGCLLVVEFFVAFLRPDGFLCRAATDMLLAVMYLGMHVLAYGWISGLARLGFFSKNVMLIGTYDPRVPVEKLFQNICGTKTFLGQMVCRDGAWLFRSGLEEAFRPIAKEFEACLFSRRVNELIICLDPDLPADAVVRSARWCRENSIGYYLIPDISKLPRTYPWGMRFQEVPQIERYCPNRDSLVMVSLKRLFDILASAAALVVLAPVFLVLSLLILAEDGGPVFYVSKRVGIHGRLIDFFKFRSMVKDAEKRKAELLALNERPDGPLFKLSRDPRVTRIGAFLRRTSLDEIPQFWNVLRGDMSLIGPRPHLPEEVAAYSDVDNLRLECMPGIACLPQIRGRDTLGFREWVDLDLEYRKNWSFLYDFRIMAQVAKVVLGPFLGRRT